MILKKVHQMQKYLKSDTTISRKRKRQSSSS